jgi:hypothetical protein
MSAPENLTRAKAGATPVAREREPQDKQPGRLIPAFLLILVVAVGLPLLGFWLPDDIFNRLGSKTRVELIESGAKFCAIFGAGFWAVALLRLLRQREIAQTTLLRMQAEIRDYNSKILKADADIAKAQNDIRESNLRIQTFDLQVAQETRARESAYRR